MRVSFYQELLKYLRNSKALAILIDPDKFDLSTTRDFLTRIPSETTHLFIGGSAVKNGLTDATAAMVKKNSSLPVFLFPGDHSQLTSHADTVLFLSLLSGRNAEYLVGQQVKSISFLRNSKVEVIPTAYLLIDGGNESAVARVTNTRPLSQDQSEVIVETALAGEYMGAKLIYLEAGSGAEFPVRPEIISEVKKAISIPLLVGGGIKTEDQKQAAYKAGADLVVMGTVFEK